jgi:hypothetical protein
MIGDQGTPSLELEGFGDTNATVGTDSGSADAIVTCCLDGGVKEEHSHIVTHR